MEVDSAERVGCKVEETESQFTAEVLLNPNDFLPDDNVDESDDLQDSDTSSPHHRRNRRPCRCLLCGQKCYNWITTTKSTKANERLLKQWQKSRAQSLCNALAVNVKRYKSTFEQGFYCKKCFQALLNIDYTMKKIQDLKRVVKVQKKEILDSIAKHYGQLTGLARRSNPEQDPQQIILALAKELNLKSTCNQPIKVEVDSEAEEEADPLDQHFTSSDEPEHPFRSRANEYQQWNSRASVIEETKHTVYDSEQKEVFCDRDEGSAMQESDPLAENEKRSKTKCHICGKPYSSRLSLRHHFRRIHLQRPYLIYRCHITTCNDSFAKNNQLNEHYQSKHPQVPREVACDECGKTYFIEAQLRRHKRATHSNVIRKCKFCDKTFNSITKLTAHQDTHNTTREFLCPRCGKGFRTKKYLINHKSVCSNRTESLNSMVIRRCQVLNKLKMSHRKKSTLPCQFCHLEFPQAGNLELEEHESLHVAKSPAILCVISPCSSEEREFPNLKDLRSHVREVHLCKPPQHCDQCPMTFKSVTGLWKHKQTAHPDQVKKRKEKHEKALKICSHSGCGLGFKNQKDLSAHRKETKHLPPKVRVSCQLCNVTCANSYQLSRHVSSAHQERGWKCGTCGKEFARQQVLQRHLKIHARESLPCPKCGKTFGLMNYLWQHEKFHCPYRDRDENGVAVKQPPKQRKKSGRTKESTNPVSESMEIINQMNEFC